LGIGNNLTLLRGVLLAVLIGFLFSPRPAGILAWIPGLLYVLAGVADLFDGYFARVQNHATRLGEILDISYDGAGIFAAALLAVQYGQVPGWYMSVALARFLFLIMIGCLNRLGRPVHELPNSASRRIFAGFQMGFLALVLLPVFTPPGTHLAAVLFAAPFLVGFIHDGLIAAGVIKPNGLFSTRLHTSRRFQLALHGWLPFFLRLLAGVVLAILLFQRFQRAPAEETLLFLSLLEALVVVLLLAGIAGRFAAVAGLVLLGFHQLFSSLSAAQVLLLAIHTAILFMGTGALSIWKPEDRLIFHRLGEDRPQRARRGV
jgi:CDP-diacylglycerol--glycerol-3-phosphate 3-phosphatidyltransferase